MRFFDGDVLHYFKTVSEEDIRTIPHSSLTKSCSLHPVPTRLLQKECEDELIPVLTLIVNTSWSPCAEFLDELQKGNLASLINTLRPRQNGSHFADIFRCISLNQKGCASTNISLKFFPKGQINIIPALVQIMYWCRAGDKPVSEPMMIN